MRKPLHARRGVSHPLGKCDSEIKTAVPAAVAEAVIALKTLTGQPSAEIIRDALTEHTLGRLAMLRPAGANNSVSLDEALIGLAVVAGVSKDEYIRSILFSHVFGDVELHKLRLSGETLNTRE